MNRRDTMAPLLVVGIAAVFLSMAPVFSFQTLRNNDTSLMPAPGQVNDTLPTNSTFYINAVRPEGTANVTEEPFPNSTLPAGRGYELNPPDEEGNGKLGRMYLIHR